MSKTLKITLNVIAGILVIAAFIALIFTQNAQAAEVQKTRGRLNDTCSKSLEDLVTITNELRNALSKVQVVNSQNQYTMLLSQIWRSSGEAVNALGNLPSSFAHVREANAFLVQTGDYAHTLLEKAATGELPTEEDKAQITALYQSCSGLYDKLNTASQQGVDFAGLIENSDYYGENETSWLQLGGAPANAGEDSTDAGNTSDGQGGTQGAQEKNDTIPEKMYPTLIYDGPFSDSTEKAEPKGLGTGEVDEAAAMQKAKEFLGDLLSGELKYEGRSDGRIPVHNFSGTAKDGRVIDIEITATGGKCLLMRISATNEQEGSIPVGEERAEADTPKPDEETGRRLAQVGKDFLKSRGFESMESTYAQYYGGMAVINYAFVQDGTLVYPDLMKVWIEVDTDGAVGFEAKNYWFSHVERSIGKPAISEEDARAKLSPALMVQSVRVALIPKGVLEEKLCYEFKCTFMEESYIVYINAATGIEEQVYKIIDSESGQLVV